MCLSMSPQYTMFVNVFAYTNTMTERATAFNHFSFFFFFFTIINQFNHTIKTKLLLDARTNADATMLIVIACIIDI